MQTKDDIYSELKRILVELFDMEQSQIGLEASLYEDLDLDSIDAIDLVVKLQQITGKKVKPEAFKSARTVEDVVNIIHNLVHE